MTVTVLAGRYRVVAELGRGASGVVYRAVDETTGESVAVKVLLDRALEDRFEREVTAVGRLDHPSIVRVLGVARHEGRPLIAMELVPGEGLDAILRRGPLEPARAAKVASELARALEHAHARGVVHRDVKPSNVILDGEGRARLVDFGLARVSGSARLTATGMLVGTPAYMSPEQADGRPCGPAADIYGLGAVLHACLAGRPPFEGANVEAILRRVLFEPARTLGALGVKVPARLEALVARCLEKDPARRFADAGALARALEGLDLAREERGRPGSRAAIGRGILGGVLMACVLAGGGGAAWVFLRPGASARVRAVAVPPPTERGDPDPRAAQEKRARDAAQSLARTAAWHASKGLDDRSEEEFAEALAASPSDAEIYRLRGIARLVRKDMNGFQGDLDQAIALAPSSANAWATRADGRLLSGDQEGAFVDASKALELDPRHATANRLMGAFLCRRGDLVRGLAHLERSAETDPREPATWSGIFEASLGLADRVRAHAALEHERALAGGTNDFRLHEARLFVFEGEHEKAVDLLDGIVESGHREPRVLLIRAQARSGAGDFEGASDDAQEILKQDPRNSRAWEVLALALYGRKWYDQALFSVTQALELGTPNEAGALFLRAQCHEKLGDSARARADFQRVIDAAPSGPDAPEARARLARLDGR